MVKIVCEGKSDIKNLKNFLKFLNITFCNDNFLSTNGKSSLLNKDSQEYTVLSTKIKDGFVQKILFVLDIDDFKNDKSICGPEQTIKKIERLQKDLDIKEISDYFLACDPTNNKGYFESLLLSTVDGKVKECYDNFRICSELNSKSVDKNILTQLHNLMKPDKPYDFSHKNFDELAEKLQNLFTEQENE